MRIKLLIVMIILGACHLLGEIKLTGKLLFPTAKGEKQYDAVITITRAEILIDCASNRLFGPFTLLWARIQRKWCTSYQS